MNGQRDERELANACIARDKLAEFELYTTYATRVFTICRRYCSNKEEALDLLQDTFITVFDKIDLYEYRGKGSLFAWISKIAINLALNQFRRRKWQSMPLGFSLHDTVAEPTEEEVETIPQEILLELIASLPTTRRAVFNLFCIDGYTHKEISKMLHISEKASASTLAKARKQLKEKIKQYVKGIENGNLGRSHKR